MAGGPSLAQQALRAYFYVVLWMTVSMAVILFNKWLLAYSGFPYPLALTIWHMVFCSAIGFLLVRVFKVVKSVNMPRRDYVRRVMPIGLLYAASLWLSNSAYLHLSVSFIQMTKALMPGLVYTTVRIAFVLFNCHVDDTDPGVHFKGVYMGTERFTYGYAANMLLIAVGVAIAAYGEINFVMIGVVQQLSALVFEATRLMLVQVLMNSQGYTLNPIQSLYYVSPACLLCLAIPFLVLEFPIMRSTDTWTLRPGVMVANAATAFCLNLAVFLLIGKTSALTMNIAGVIKDWMLIWMSMRMFTAPVTALNLLGYTVAFLGVCFYNYMKLNAAKAAKTGKGAPSSAGAAGTSKGDEEAARGAEDGAGDSEAESKAQ